MAKKTLKTFLPALPILLILAAAAWFGRGLIGYRGGKCSLQGAVVVFLDTVRRDHLSCYGYGRETAPALSRLAKKGVLFEKTVSFAPWTLPSTVSFLSGCKPNASVFDRRLKRSLVESIRDAGYATAAFTEGGYVSRFYGIDRGFDDFREEEGAVQLLSPGEKRNPKAKGGIENTFRLAKKWLAAHKDGKFFLFIHTYEAHAPYTRRTFTKGLDPGRVGPVMTLEKLPLLREGKLVFDEKDLKYLTALYDGGIRECDRRVGDLLSYLEELDLDKKTLVMVMSDHGEELGAHFPTHAADHGHALFDDEVLVPLILYNPLEDYPVKRVPFQVRLMDAMPTVAQILGAKPDYPLQGTSLLALMRGVEKRGRLADGGATKSGPERMFLRWLDYKYIKVIGPGKGAEPLTPRPPAVQLYDLLKDPGERNNLAREKPGLVRRMAEIAARDVSASGGGERFTPPEEMDEMLKKRLESLGYVR